MKDKYEISIWEDNLEYGRSIDSISNYEFYNSDNIPSTYGGSNPPDRKIAVIGSDTMTSPIRAEEPKLIQNINGTSTFTFKMRYVYNIQGEKKKNPFLSLLVNERKIKVFWKDEWYDFVIKDCQENSSDKSITYTCKDLFINELSKNGFNLEFDTELMNNQGSAQELAAKILEGTDWKVDEANSDIVFQENEEAVYEGHITYSGGLDVEGLDRETGMPTTVHIAQNDKILVYYSIFENKISDCQFHWAGSGSSPFETDGSNMLVTNGQCLLLEGGRWYRVTNVASPIYDRWVYIKNMTDDPNADPSVLLILNGESGIEPSISLNYRAKRLIGSQLLVADQLTGKQCLVYHNDEDEYYAFSETEYSSANLAVSYVTNNKDFVNVLGWIYPGISATVCPAINEEHQTPYDGKGYLFLPSGTVAFNNGLSDFHSFIQNGFTKGEKYFFRIKARKNVVDQVSENNKPDYDKNNPLGGYCDLEHEQPNPIPGGQPITVPNSIDIIPKVYKYKITDGVVTRIGNSIFDLDSGNNPDQFGDWIRFTLVCNESISYNDIVKKTSTYDGYGLFIDNSAQEGQGRLPGSQGSTPIWIENVEFFKLTSGKPIVQEYNSSIYYNENDYVKVTSQQNENVYTIYKCIRANRGAAFPDGEQGDYNTWWFIKETNNTPEENKLKSDIVYPGSFNTESLAKEVWRIYKVDPNITDPNDIVYEYSGTQAQLNSYCDQNSIVPSYGPHGKYEKIRSITGKQSNRFNLLQSIAETFQVWIKFYIDHDKETGAVKVGTNGKPIKRIIFLNQIGENNGIGFVYGTDLKSISRVINSDQITSKVIVSQNNNQFGKSGFCSIARSRDNYPKVNYILNFDYYFSHNLLSKDEVLNDLYYIPSNPNVIEDGADYIGYYTRLHYFNSNYDAATQELLKRNNEYVKVSAKRDYLEATIKSAYQEVNQLENDLAHYAGYETYDEDKVAAYLQDRGKDDTIAQNAWKTMIGLLGQIAIYEDQKENTDILITQLETTITRLESEQQDCVEKIQIIDDKFFSKYYRFIQEGSWTSDQYYDDDLYYLDALSTAYTSSRPQVSYNIAVIRISGVKGFENKVFNLGDISYVQDIEFFGYAQDGVTPYKERVVISEITSNFDSPQNDEIKVQNYKTQFEDLFQRIAAATQSLQFSSGAYDNTVSNFTLGGTLKGDNLQDSINQNDGLSWAADNDTVLFTKDGLIIMDPDNPSKIVKVTASGIQFSEDGGATWSPAITGKGTDLGSLGPGIISTDHINIMGGGAPTFSWNSYGLNAYSYDTVNNETTVEEKKFVRFDKFGLYGVNRVGDESFDKDWKPASEQDIKDVAQFGLTWDGFFLKTNHAFSKDGVVHNTTVEISSQNDFAIVDDTDPDNPIRRVKIGDISASGETGNFGVQINNADGVPVFFTDQYGNLQVQSTLTVGPHYDAAALVRISPYKPTRAYDSDRVYYPAEYVTFNDYYYECIEKTVGNEPTDDSYWTRRSPTTDPDPNPPSENQVLNACNSFIIYADGSVDANNIRIEGGSIDASTSIIGKIGGFRVDGDKLVSTNLTGPTLTLNGGAGTITGYTPPSPWVEVTDTLSAGNTSITISNAAITSSSTLDIYVDTDGVYPTSKTVLNGSLTLTFEAQQSAVQIKVRIS